MAIAIRPALKAASLGASMPGTKCRLCRGSSPQGLYRGREAHQAEGAAVLDRREGIGRLSRGRALGLVHMAAGVRPHAVVSITLAARCIIKHITCRMAPGFP